MMLLGFLKSLVEPRSAENQREREFVPEATVFKNAVGETANYYFRNNPWKLPQDNQWQKVYRFCVICGDERFSSKEWAGVIQLWGPPAVCDKYSCYEGIAFFAGFVPRKHYLVETEQDKSRVEMAGRADMTHRLQFFEEVEDVTTLMRNDKVYDSEQDMPQEYLEVFRRLEKFPVETRVAEIDSLYFGHKEKHNIHLREGERLADAPDPFLRALGAYRQKCISILNSLHQKV